MLKFARKAVILVIGVTVILIGLVLIFTPGPALLVIPLGLAILGTEFIWARRILKRMKDEGGKVGRRFFGSTTQERNSNPHNDADNVP